MTFISADRHEAYGCAECQITFESFVINSDIISIHIKWFIVYISYWIFILSQSDQLLFAGKGSNDVNETSNVANTGYEECLTSKRDVWRIYVKDGDSSAVICL